MSGSNQNDFVKSGESKAPEVRHRPELHRFEILHESAEAAVLTYRPSGTCMDFDHTYVPEPMRGRGIAALLTRAALEHARRESWKVIPSCTYVAAFIKRHPEFQGLIHSP